MAEITSKKLTQTVLSKYALSNNALAFAPKRKRSDRLEVEIGDVLQPDKFYPQVKLKRWDNEANFSVRLKEEGTEAEEISAETDKVIYRKGQRTCRFYDGPVLDEDGSYEFDVVLSEKPLSNVLEFTMETKGLVFYYQAPRDAQIAAEEKSAKARVPSDWSDPAWIAKFYDPNVRKAGYTATSGPDGVTRPENAVGSYAVFLADRKAGDYSQVGGHNYRHGKAFHIYRPLITDASGRKIWGELFVDAANGLMRVTVPQEFLDTAVYPVNVDPTFGYTTVGASEMTTFPDYIFGSNYTASEVWTGISISAHMKWQTNVNTSCQTRMGVYSGSTLVTNGDAGLYTFSDYDTYSWRTLNFSGQPNGDAASYRLVVWFDAINISGTNTNAAIKIDTGVAGNGCYKKTTYTGEALPIDDADLATPYTAEDKTKVETDDSIMVAASAESGFALHLFKDHVIITPGCSFTWTGRSNIDASVSSVFLQIYNRQSGAWETLDSDTTTIAGTKITLWAQVGDLTNYKDGNSVVACRVYQADAV